VLADPQTITVNSVAKVLARVGNSASSANYVEPEGLFTLDTYRTLLKSNDVRHVATFKQKKLSDDPLLEGVSTWRTMTLSFSATVPSAGFTAAEQALLLDGFLDWLRASTDAVPIALMAGQI
jgi:hypothetical protein